MNPTRFLPGRLLTLAAASVVCTVLIGCRDPGYRTDVTTTGEGGVTVVHPPSDARPASADPVQSSLQRDVSAQDRAQALEAQLRERDAEIARLKRQLATQPATTP